MKPVDPEAPARRDGYLERKGVWGEVVVGSLLAGEKRSDVWEVTDTQHGQKVEHAYTLWFRLVNRTTGVQVAQPPKMVKDPVTFLVETPEQEQPAYTPPSDTDAVMLVVEELGATILATRDNVTGEVVCPNYAAGYSVGDNKYGVEEIEHLRVCHGMDVRHLETLRGNDAIVQRNKAHGDAHNSKRPTLPGGFPHRHVPEDHSFL